MDSVSAALLVGILGVCVVIAFTKRMASRWEEKRTGVSPDAEEPAEQKIGPEARKAAYRTILIFRLTSLGLCLAAVAVLYFQLGTAAALVLAGVACVLQYFAFKTRMTYLRAERLVPQKNS